MQIKLDLLAFNASNFLTSELQVVYLIESQHTRLAILKRNSDLVASAFLITHVPLSGYDLQEFGSQPVHVLRIFVFLELLDQSKTRILSNRAVVLYTEQFSCRVITLTHEFALCKLRIGFMNVKSIADAQVMEHS